MEEKYRFLHHYKDNDYESPKEIFKFIADIMEKNSSEREGFSCLDIGCAKGEFLYYLKKRFSAFAPYLCGVDFSQTLIGQAKEFSGLAGVDFNLGQAEEFKIEKKFNFITATGIISFYDDYTSFLENLFDHLKDDGVMIITNGFIISEYDLISKFRRYDQKNKMEEGWNQHSIQGVEKYVEDQGRRLLRHKFELPFTLKKGKDVTRSWTIQTEEGQKFINGLNIIWDLWSLEIRR